MLTETKESVPSELRIFYQFGIEIPETPNVSQQYVCDCPWCGKERHLFLTVSAKNKSKFKGDGPFFNCKSCGEAGNKYTFLKLVYAHAKTHSTKGSYTRIGLKRKQPAEVFSAGGVAFYPTISRWLFPTINAKGGITNLHTWDGKGAWISAAGCNLHLLGLHELKPQGPIAICEGHWDKLSFQHLLSKCTKQPENWSVLAVPGADCFPPEDLAVLTGRDVYLLYDNDEAGYRGMRKAAQALQGKALSVHTLEWPPNRYRDGYDLTDLIRESDRRSDATIEELLSWCHRVEGGALPGEEILPLLTRVSLEEVYKDFRETGIHLYPGLKDSLAVTLAVIHSIKLKGEPLWMYMIGVSGAGKSLILESTLASNVCLYRTSITFRSLISGFSGGDDPSLLAKLPGKALVVKDYSNVLALPVYEQDLLFSALREAYDGRVYRDFGNGVIRQYPIPGSGHEDCCFSFVAGVTPEIYARHHSALGERFLRFHIPRTGADDLRAIETAMDDSWRTHQQAKRRQAGIAGFLSYLESLPSSQEELPTIPEWYRRRIVALAQFVGYCRSHVSRTKEDLDYEPAVESGTRMAKQLRKLSQSVARVLGLRAANSEVYRLVRKVAWDTAHGWRRTIYQAIHQQGEGECTSLCKITGYSHTTVHRQLRDMHSLGVLKKGSLIPPAGGSGRPRQTYLLSARATEIYETAKIGEIR